MRNISEKRLLQGCLKGDRKSQNSLYENYKIRMFRLCLRYARDNGEAEDLLQESFIKVFKDLKNYKGKGSLGAWIRKVTLNVALQHVRRKKIFFSNDDMNQLMDYKIYEEISIDSLDAKNMTKMLQVLPEGYRTVFNLYVIEEYKHKEISEMLGISISTSKSQLHKAKAMLKGRLEKVLVS